MGKLGGFRRLYGEADPESGSGKRFSKKGLKLGGSKAGYESVSVDGSGNGSGSGSGKPLTKQELAESTMEADNPGLEEPMSPEVTDNEDFYKLVYAPVSLASRRIC